MPPPPSGAADAESGRHAQPAEATVRLRAVSDEPGARQLETPIESPWSPPGAVIAPPEAGALALAAPTSLPAVADAAPALAPPLMPIPGEEAAPIPEAEAAPAPAAPLIAQRTTQQVTCPQCGTVVRIDPRARSSLDFCPNPICDYPLFWVRSAIVVTEDVDDGASHRRMPGTAGRAAAAYLPCPHCSEPNPLSATMCVRCGGDMHPVAPAAPPPAVVVPVSEPLLPMIEEEDEPINWWLIIIGGIAITLFVAFLVVIALSYM